MTKDAIDQIFDRARHGDVFAQVLMGQILLEGKYVRADQVNGIGWLRNAAQCNCLYARDLLNDLSGKHPQPSRLADGNASGTGSNTGSLNAMAELNSLIGLAKVKEEVESLRNLIKIQTMRARQGLPNTNMSYHMVFTGNPGTGKTTVARIVAEIYKEIGILKKGHLVETDRAGLVAEYVGQTAPKTNAKIDEALDGVLFIDEAYTLVGGENDYGAEAIATLLKRMEDDRDRLVVILAGYTNEIKGFIDSNPGLQSRFNRYIQFDDYSADELLDILRLNLKKSRYKIKRDAFEWMHNYIKKKVVVKDEKFGNARFIRNAFEKIIQRQADRLARQKTITDEELTVITLEDVNKLK
jgi:SpoVK/Ycf46/Vps4 family AAA+-type ATPase